MKRGAVCRRCRSFRIGCPPFPTEIALQLIEEDLGVPASAIMSTITPEPVAAASLGQVRACASGPSYLSTFDISARTFARRESAGGTGSTCRGVV